MPEALIIIFVAACWFYIGWNIGRVSGMKEINAIYARVNKGE